MFYTSIVLAVLSCGTIGEVYCGRLPNTNLTSLGAFGAQTAAFAVMAKRPILDVLGAPISTVKLSNLEFHHDSSFGNT